MSTVEVKSVLIEGDKSFFVSKAAIERFKRDLKNDDQEKLKNSEYFKEGWTYQLLSNVNNEIKVNIINKLDIKVNNEPVKPRVLEMSEHRQMLKNRIKELTNKRSNNNNLKSKLKNLPDDLADAYKQVKKANLPVSIHDPADVLAKKDEYRNIIHTMIQSFGNYKGPSNPVINYYKLLAKYLDINPNPPQQKQNNNRIPTTQEFLEELKNQKLENVVDKEMNEIYNSIGLNKQNENNDETDDEEDEELNNILSKLGLNKELEV